MSNKNRVSSCRFYKIITILVMASHIFIIIIKFVWSIYNINLNVFTAPRVGCSLTVGSIIYILVLMSFFCPSGLLLETGSLNSHFQIFRVLLLNFFVNIFVILSLLQNDKEIYEEVAKYQPIQLIYKVIL